MCDETQSPLSPLLHTHRACFWHTALEELEPTVAIHGTDAKDTQHTHSKQTKGT